MTKEDKDLLLKDLCARLTYGIKVHLETPKYGELIGTLDAVYPTDDRVIVDNLSKAIAPINVRTGGFLIGEDNVKPFLRPMSSMTEEERDEVEEISHGWFYINEDGEIFPTGRLTDSGEFEDAILPTFEYFLKTHIDYRGLIEKGLAIEAPEGMY